VARWHTSISHHFGIHPWQYDRLTYQQFMAYVANCEAFEREAKKG
jgi:hypothetical protein